MRVFRLFLPKKSLKKVASKLCFQGKRYYICIVKKKIGDSSPPSYSPVEGGL